MHVGVLTQPMAANYGCNLQAYALQTILERMGCEVELLDRWPNLESKRNTSFHLTARFMKDIIKLVIGRPIFHIIDLEDRSYYWQNFIRFQQQYLHLSKKLNSTKDLKDYSKHKKYDAFVVGSDQVWRPAYNSGDILYNMFLDFSEDEIVKRVSYAASFGVDNWEYSEVQTLRCGELLSKFDAVSVREKSGVKLCAENFGINAYFVLDPTLLLSTVDYNALIDNTLNGRVEGGLFCYILDSSSTTLRTMDYLERSTGLKRFICLPLVPENSYDVFNKKSCILPSPEEWLRCFRDAEMVLVDSFHGMVFSIIYNKPFWVIGNSKRGMARFHSLLSLFNLENRLVSAEQLQTIDLNQSINWDLVNKAIVHYRAQSLDFLDAALKK